MAEIGEIGQIRRGKLPLPRHRRKYRAKALAIAAGIADFYIATGFEQCWRVGHAALLSRRKKKVLF
jgi:hypothetical protein